MICLVHAQVSRFGSDECPSTAKERGLQRWAHINPPGFPLRKHRRDYYGYYGRYDDDGDYHERED